jgi:hypothetical protein
MSRYLERLVTAAAMKGHRVVEGALKILDNAVGTDLSHARWVGLSKELINFRLTADEALRPQNYQVAFPEHYFPPRRTVEKKYRDELARGVEHARSSRILFCMLLYNRVELVPLLRARLAHLAEPLGQHNVLILGSDSTDGTAEALDEWRAEDPAVLPSPHINPLPPCGRISRIALLRNALLEGIDWKTPPDYIVMLDGDLAGPVSRDGLLHSLALMSADTGAPDVITAFGINNYTGVPVFHAFVGHTYYDPFAFREHSNHRVPDYKIRLRLSGLRRGDPVIASLSGFGGMGIYRAELLKNVRYDESGEDCEHVTLHSNLRKLGARHVVNPSLLLLAGRQGHHLVPDDAPRTLFGQS